MRLREMRGVMGYRGSCRHRTKIHSSARQGSMAAFEALVHRKLIEEGVHRKMDAARRKLEAAQAVMNARLRAAESDI